MIFNRTQEHVDEALKLRATKIQKFEELTDDEKYTLERGFVTVETLNRIESKTEELKNNFESDFYLVDKIETKEWNYSDYFTVLEFNRIIKNLDLLKKAYFVYQSTPGTPDAEYYYTVFNAIEEGLHDLERMISDIHTHYRYCGGTICGGETND